MVSVQVTNIFMHEFFNREEGKDMEEFLRRFEQRVCVCCKGPE